MKFEVVRSSDDHTMMSTEYESCIPYEHVDSMSQSGYYFRLDGKKISAKAIKLLQKDKKEIDVILPNCNTSEAKLSININKPSETDARPKSIRCVDTGEIFKNQAEAARHFNIDPAQVSDSIKTGRPRSGHTFEKVVS